MPVPTQVTPDEMAGDLSSRGNGQASVVHTGPTSAPTASSGDVSERIRMRRTFDLLVSAAGLLMVGVLVVAGSLLTWGHFYIGNEVHNQLAAQKIVFPAANSPAVAAPEFQAMRQYGGQEMTTGAQAEVYADHFIANHLKKIGGGETYAQLSTQSLAQPNNAKLAAQVDTVFKGETLRGLLLNAYAFGTIGVIAGIAAIAAFVAAALLLALSLAGLFHGRRKAQA
jgi:hypothetical protein